MKIISKFRQSPLVAKILTIIALLFLIESLLTTWWYQDRIQLLFALGFVIIGITANIPDAEVKSFLFTGCLALSHLCLQIAAWLNGVPSRSTFDLATISGETSKEDPAEAPVLITDLLGILDRSIGNHIELDIPGYRIRATAISALDEFIEKTAGREGKPLPELKPWFARKG